MEKTILTEKLNYIRANISAKQITLCVEKVKRDILAFSIYYRKTYLCVMALSAHDSEYQINEIIKNIENINTAISSLIIQGKVKYEIL